MIDFVYYSFLICNIAIPVWESMSEALIKDMNDLKVSFCLLIGIQIVSCFFLFDACRRIAEVLKQSTDCKVNVTAISIHVFAYLLYLGSTVYFLISYIWSQNDNSHAFMVEESIKSACSCLSQIVLCYVFYTINKNNNEE